MTDDQNKNQSIHSNSIGTGVKLSLKEIGLVLLRGIPAFMLLLPTIFSLIFPLAAIAHRNNPEAVYMVIIVAPSVVYFILLLLTKKMFNNTWNTIYKEKEKTFLKYIWYVGFGCSVSAMLLLLILYDFN